MTLRGWIQKKEHNVTRRKRWVFPCYRVKVEAEMVKWKDEKRAKCEERCLKVRVMNCLLNSNSLLSHLLQIWSSWSITNMAESWVFWTKPILINPPQAAAFYPFFQICETSRNRGVEKESGHCVMSVLPAVLPRMGVPPEWAMNARD